MNCNGEKVNKSATAPDKGCNTMSKQTVLLGLTSKFNLRVTQANVEIQFV